MIGCKKFMCTRKIEESIHMQTDMNKQKIFREFYLTEQEICLEIKPKRSKNVTVLFKENIFSIYLYFLLNFPAFYFIPTLLNKSNAREACLTNENETTKK